MLAALRTSGAMAVKFVLRQVDNFIQFLTFDDGAPRIEGWRHRLGDEAAK